MAGRSSITADYLRSILDYDPATGVFIWRERPAWHFHETKTRSAEHTCKNWNKRFRGKRAGVLNARLGYRVIRIAGVNYYEHRLAYLFMTGDFPPVQIDHANQDRSANRWRNLREATHFQNRGNQKPRKDSISGIKGVFLDRRYNTWQARISAGGKRYHLGSFATADQAAKAYRAAATRLFGEFASP